MFTGGIMFLPVGFGGYSLIYLLFYGAALLEKMDKHGLVWTDTEEWTKCFNGEVPSWGSAFPGFG